MALRFYGLLLAMERAARGKSETCNVLDDIINLRIAAVMSQKLPSVWSILVVSLFLSVVGWGGLALLLYLTVPTLLPRWLFFFLLTLALSGLALPVTYFFNRRFPSVPPVEAGVVLREAMWVGIYGSLLAWLQMGRVLTPALIITLMVGLVLVELLLRISERSQWPPVKRAAPPVRPAYNEEDEDDFEDEDA